MKKIILKSETVRHQFILRSILLLLTCLFFQTSFAYDLEGYKNTNRATDKTVQTVNKPSVQEEDDCIGLICECVNDKWSCSPAGCGLGMHGNACGGAIESNGVPLNSRSIPAISEPSLTNPTREIDPRSIPGGDQFDPKSIPGDQLKN